MLYTVKVSGTFTVYSLLILSVNSKDFVFILKQKLFYLVIKKAILIIIYILVI